jgi:hypothetical protein
MRWMVLALALAACTKSNPQTCDSVFFADADGDGFGNQSDSVTGQCRAPEGFVDNLDDCDDSSAAIHPGAIESCNLVDDNCDGVTDLDATVGTVVVHPDADGDGFGAPEIGDPICPTVGYVSDDSDCDDTNVDVNPGMTEVCGNHLDDDCDGTSNGCVDPGGTNGDADAVIRTDGSDSEMASAGVGFAVGTSDIDGDGFADAILGGPLYGSDTSGAIYLLWGGPAGFDVQALNASDRIVGDQPGGLLGYSMATHLDLDGDGREDAVVSAFVACDGGPPDSCGAVYVIAGGTTRPSGATIGDIASASIFGPESSVASAVAGLGDLDGDNRDDLGIGAPSLGDGFAVPSVYVFSGRGDIADLSAATPDLTVAGDAATLGLGDLRRFTAADLDGDGSRDLVVGSARADDPAYATEAFVYYGDLPSGTVSLSDADAAVFSVPAQSPYGSWQLASGDLDGDGIDDLVAGLDRTSASNVWNVYVFPGDSTRHTTPYAAGDAVWSVAGGPSDTALSLSVADPDADGTPDLLIGSPYQSDLAYEGGAVYLLVGPRSGALTIADADSVWRGNVDHMWLGNSLDLGGDVDGDGFADLLVGAPALDVSGSGYAFLFLGTGL